jgi:hypothetical protein
MAPGIHVPHGVLCRRMRSKEGDANDIERHGVISLASNDDDDFKRKFTKTNLEDC